MRRLRGRSSRTSGLDDRRRRTATEQEACRGGSWRRREEPSRVGCDERLVEAGQGVTTHEAVQRWGPSQGASGGDAMPTSGNAFGVEQRHPPDPCARRREPPRPMLRRVEGRPRRCGRLPTRTRPRRRGSLSSAGDVAAAASSPPCSTGSESMDGGEAGRPLASMELRRPRRRSWSRLRGTCAGCRGSSSTAAVRVLVSRRGRRAVVRRGGGRRPRFGAPLAATVIFFPHHLVHQRHRRARRTRPGYSAARDGAGWSCSPACSGNDPGTHHPGRCRKEAGDDARQLLGGFTELRATLAAGPTRTRAQGRRGRRSRPSSPAATTPGSRSTRMAVW